MRSPAFVQKQRRREKCVAAHANAASVTRSTAPVTKVAGTVPTRVNVSIVVIDRVMPFCDFRATRPLSVVVYFSFCLFHFIFVLPIMLLEFRCPLPYCVEDPNIGYLYMVMEANLEATGGGEGVEWEKNEP